MGDFWDANDKGPEALAPTGGLAEDVGIRVGVGGQGGEGVWKLGHRNTEISTLGSFITRFWV